MAGEGGRASGGGGEGGTVGRGGVGEFSQLLHTSVPRGVAGEKCPY